MNNKLKTAALMYALGDANLEDIVRLGGIQAGTVAHTMRGVIEAIQRNVQPKPRWGFISDTDGRLMVYTPKWEVKLFKRHITLTARATGEIVKEW
jgi:hypothetical protein